MSSTISNGGLPPSYSVTPDKRLPAVDRSRVDPQMLQAAEGMEGMFLDYLMKVMRDSVPKADESSPATQIYQSMRDSEFAKTAAKRGGIGLADQIIAYLEAERYNLGAGPGMAPEKSKGASHEGQPLDRKSESNERIGLHEESK